MERIYMFLPSILIIASIAIASHLYLRWITKRWSKKINNDAEWVKKNQWKIAFGIGNVNLNIFSPALTEIIFRTPLIVVFSTVSETAWYGVLTSAILHASRSYWLGKEKTKLIRILNFFFVSLLGILTGYYGIKYQSLWVSVGIHSLWNLIMPAMFPLCEILRLLFLTLWERDWAPRRTIH